MAILLEHREKLPFSFKLLAEDDLTGASPSLGMERRRSKRSQEQDVIPKPVKLAKQQSSVQQKKYTALKLVQTAEKAQMSHGCQILRGMQNLLGSCETNHDLLMLEKFYTREDNTTLFNLYKLVCESNENKDGLSYLDLKAQFNDINKWQKKRYGMNCKLTAQDAAHYCKKLEKVGFVDSESL